MPKKKKLVKKLAQEQKWLVNRNNMMYASFAKKMESRDPICTHYNPIQSIAAFV
jgi:hypothetical protein